MRVLCLNAGSSSLKAAGYAADPDIVELLTFDAEGERSFAQVARACDAEGFVPDVVAHRIVHGGPNLLDHTVIDRSVRAELDAAVAFAPLHLPAALAILDAASQSFPECTHIACLDTAFHRTLPPVNTRLPLPDDDVAGGVRRYGFHGLSYEYLVSRLGDSLGSRAVLAHLGNGASLAAVADGISVDTTMGFTPAGGLVMGTRTGDIDPGALIHIMRTNALDADGLENLIDRRSGLAAVGGSADVRTLLAARGAGDPRAALALDIFTSIAAKHVAALTTVLGGLDTLVFTGGIGEHAAPVRAEIVARLTHLGPTLDGKANRDHAPTVSEPGSPVAVRVEPTDEALMMARHAYRLAAGAR
jgi:acetate kinase